uniref:GPI mannosyltransferase 2 subunit n=1 Tax=Talaromyces marneffei PM1 TaxID=1077442 RepID=A0A093UQM6_TALMA
MASTFYLRLISILLFIQHAAANTEKTIFVAPLPWAVPAENAAIDDLGLDRLSPTDFMLRTNLNASFPTDEEPHGAESWFYLEDLTPGQRYEVRICWMATVFPLSPDRTCDLVLTRRQQPTSFDLTTYTLQEVVSSRSLLTSLLNFSDALLASTSLPPASRDRSPASPHGNINPSKARHQHNSRKRRSRTPLEREEDPLALTSHAESVLFLRIWAAADYYTTNTTLMQNVPPVMADIILDPFLWNVFPRSLVPTAVYTVVIAVVAYFVGGYLAKVLSDVVKAAVQKDEAGKGENKKGR